MTDVSMVELHGIPSEELGIPPHFLLGPVAATFVLHAACVECVVQSQYVYPGYSFGGPIPSANAVFIPIRPNSIVLLSEGRRKDRGYQPTKESSPMRSFCRL